MLLKEKSSILRTLFAYRSVGKITKLISGAKIPLREKTVLKKTCGLIT